MLSDDQILSLAHQAGVKIRTGKGAIALSRAIEAEVRKQDEALIRQLVEALDGSIAITMVKIDLRNAALIAGRARLEDAK